MCCENMKMEKSVKNVSIYALRERSSTTHDPRVLESEGWVWVFLLIFHRNHEKSENK